MEVDYMLYVFLTKNETKYKNKNKNALLQVKCCLILREDFGDQQKEQGSPHL